LKSLQVVKTGSVRAPDPEDRGRVEVRDIPEPQLLHDDDVKIKVAYCSICGSDPHLIEGIFGWQVPFGLGHELSGVITELGPGAAAKGLKVGDRVAGNFLHFCGSCYYCRNGQQQFCENIPEGNAGMSEYVIWDASQVFVLPDGISLRKGCLLEPVSVAVRIADKLAMKAGQRVFISGCGPIGLFALQILKMYGASVVAVSEVSESRLALAKKLGADFTINPAETSLQEAADAITGGRGFDAVVEVSGNKGAAAAMPGITAKGGTIIYGAQYPRDFDLPFNLYNICFEKELTVTGIYVSPYCFPRALQLLPRMQLDEFVKTSYPLEQGVEAFQAQFEAKSPKVLIECNRDIANL